METDAHTDDLTSRQWAAIDALLQQGSITKAARDVKVNRSTLTRWMKQPDFQRAYRAARSRLSESAITLLVRHSEAAAIALLGLIASAATPPAVKLAACSRVLDFALRAVEIDDLAARLEVLEEQMNGGSER